MLLVTGATGFLGAALVQELLNQGAAVRATIRSAQRAEILPTTVELAAADLADEDSLTRAMAGCDGVFHLAAALGGTLDESRRLNVDGTRHVLNAARRACVRRIVYTSSSAAIIDAAGLVSERAAGDTALTDSYSVTKADAERVIFAAVREGIDARIVNVVNAYGPSPRGAQSYNYLLLAAVQGTAGPLIDAQVGWVLAEDVARGHVLAYEHGEAGRRYVLCGEVARFSTVINGVAALWGSPHRMQALPPGTTLPTGASPFARRSEVYGRLPPMKVDDAQARAIGFAGRGIDAGLRLTVHWLRSLPPP